MDGYRVFTWNTDAFPESGGHVVAAGRHGLPRHYDHRPRREVRARLLGVRPGADRDVLCRTEGGDIYIGQVWPGDTAFPDFVTEEARTWWGELNAAHVRFGLAGHLERHERAGHRQHPARPDAFRQRAATPTSATTTSTRC